MERTAVESQPLAPREVEAAIGAITASHDGLRRHLHPLSDRERNRRLKWRPGADTVLALVTHLARTHDLRVDRVPVEAVLEAEETARMLRPLVAALAAYQRAVEDSLFMAESQAWTGAALYYSLLARVSRHDPELASSLLPARQAFARRSSAALEERSEERVARAVRVTGERAAAAKRKQDGRRVAHGEATVAEAPASAEATDKTNTTD